MDLRPYQIQITNDIYAAWQYIDNVCAVLPTGAGKCLGKGTPILMFNGQIKNVENVSMGDLLMGPDSKPRVVLSTCQGKEELYRITPVKGDSYIVNKSHILSLKQTGLKSLPRYPCQKGKGNITNISVTEYLKKSKHFKHTHKGWRTGVNWSESKLIPALPPYLLGLWLGDGHSRTPTITTEDQEIVKYLYSFAKSNNQIIRVENIPNNSANSIHICANWQRKGTFKTALISYDLIGNKHIPHDYKTGSKKQRLELLAGLIDTDGSKSNNGYDYISKSKKLAEDVMFIARSLGFSSYISKQKKTCGNNGVSKHYYRLTIYGDTYKIPVKIPYKKTEPRKQVKSVLVTGIKVESIGIGDYYGFEIDSDHLFMLGDFTVTHNTVLFSNILSNYQGASIAIAHRQELVGQMSLALAKYGVYHRIIGNNNIIKWIVHLHMQQVGHSFYDPSARCGVAGVDTLIRRENRLKHWLDSIGLWVIDECHHLLEKNKWGKAVAMLPKGCKGLGVTATPVRADGKGLGRHHDGLMDIIIEGPSMRELINMQYLTDYKIFAPPNDLNLDVVPVTQSGDFSPKQLKTEVRRSTIMGDIVEHYLRITPGKLGVTFATDVETASEIAGKFRAAGVPAEVISAKTPGKLRIELQQKFKRKEILQLVNVDLFGEGYDLPALEVVQMARPTESFALFCQQFGRALRILEGKTGAIIIDHVGNVTRHATVETDPVTGKAYISLNRKWSLDRREKRSSTKEKLSPVKTCKSCFGLYEAFYKMCPFCGYVNIPTFRDRPEMVDGDLTELDPAVLAAMRKEVNKIDTPVDRRRSQLQHGGMKGVVLNGAVKNHRVRQEAQGILRDSIALWAGHRKAAGQSDSEIYRRFYFGFDIDIYSAKTLGKNDAYKLNDRVREAI